MKNADIRRELDRHGIEWVELARYCGMSMKDLTRRLNGKTIFPAFRKNLLKAITALSRRPEDFYDEFR